MLSKVTRWVVVGKPRTGVWACTWGIWCKAESLKDDALRRPWRSGTCVRSRSYSSEAVDFNV